MSNLNRAFHKNSLPITGEFISDPHGNICPVLDTSKIDFSNSVRARKKQTTLVMRASGGEKLGQTFNGLEETFQYITEKNDAIFSNSAADQYVPSSKDGGRLKFDDLESNGFRIISHDDEHGHVHVQSPAAQLLVGVINQRVCIKNAWGDDDKPENHQFLSKGATLKLSDDGKVTGIDKEGLEKWDVPTLTNTYETCDNRMAC